MNFQDQYLPGLWKQLWGFFWISHLCGYPHLASGSSSQDCRFSVGVGVALSSPDLIVFRLKAVKWVIHPMFFPSLKCPLSSVLFIAQCLQVTCFCILSGRNSCHRQEDHCGGQSLLGPTRPRTLLPVLREPSLPSIL